MRMHHRDRIPGRIVAIAAVLAMLGAAGCASSTEILTGPSSTTTTVTITATSAPAETTSEPDCSEARLNTDLGRLGYAACADGWAAVQPAEYTDACVDCETMWLARWDGRRWGLHARCHVYVVLTPAEHGCAAVSGTFADETDTGELGEFPDPETACAIWGYNTVEESLDATGCTEQ